MMLGYLVGAGGQVSGRRRLRECGPEPGQALHVVGQHAGAHADHRKVGRVKADGGGRLPGKGEAAGGCVFGDGREIFQDGFPAVPAGRCGQQGQEPQDT